MRRAFWFAAGVASGVYGVFKVKRTLDVFTPDGFGARVAAVRHGARVFADGVSEAAHEREADLLAELGTNADDRMLPAAAHAPRHAAPLHDHRRTRPRKSVTDGHR